MPGWREWVLAVALLGAAIALSAVCYHFYYVEWSPIAPKSLDLWADREQAYGHDRTKPVGAVAKGERLDVMWDGYGKDYWACYVRTQKGEKGWVLCTDL